MRLRDLGGLIVIDFIDMSSGNNQRLVEQELKNALSMDRARVQIGRISRFGLLEMSRQRLRPALNESREVVCPRCNGIGNIRSVETLSLNVLRLIEEEAMKDNTAQVCAELPIEIATYLINEKRSTVDGIEKRQQVHILLIPNNHMVTPEYKVQRIRIDEMATHQSNVAASYKLVNKPEETDYSKLSAQTKEPVEQPAVQQITHATVMPPPPASITALKKAKKGLLSKIWSMLVGKESVKKDDDATDAKKPYRRRYNNTSRNRPHYSKNDSSRNSNRPRSNNNRSNTSGPRPQSSNHYSQRSNQQRYKPSPNNQNSNNDYNS